MNKVAKLSASVLAAVALHLPAMAAPILDQNHPVPVGAFCAVTMTDWCGQSFQQTNANISGAGIYLVGSEGGRTDPATLTMSVYSSYGGSGLSGLVASGSTAIAGNYFGFVDIFWTPAAVQANTQHYLVLGSTNNVFASFSTSTYANGTSLFQGGSISNYDLTFRTFADNGAPQDVPEPGALALLGLGLAGLVAARRKKRG